MYHCFQAKDDLHVFDRGHKCGQKSVCVFQEVQGSLIVFFVAVLHDRIDLSRDNTQPSGVLKAQRLRIHLWPF